MNLDDKQALWAAYLAASRNQDKADRTLAVAVETLRYATQHAKNCAAKTDEAHKAYEAYEAWSNA